MAGIITWLKGDVKIRTARHWPMMQRTLLLAQAEKKGKFEAARSPFSGNVNFGTCLFVGVMA
jgi:hypothetical protein